MAPISTPRLPPVPPARSCKATGISTVAGTTRSAGHVQSLITSTPVRCRPISCATVGSTRWPTLYSCSFATLPTATWSAGSTGNSKMPTTQPAPTGCARLREALIGPLREVYGVSDKVLTMTLSCILLAAPKRLPAGTGRRQHDCHRHPGAQLSGPHRHPGKVRCRPFVWCGLLPGWRLRRHHRMPWRPGSMPGSSIPGFRSRFRGSSSTRSGGTAPSPASTSATAIALMIASLATNVYCQIRSHCDRIVLSKRRSNYKYYQCIIKHSSRLTMLRKLYRICK